MRIDVKAKAVHTRNDPLILESESSRLRVAALRDDCAEIFRINPKIK